MRLIVARIGRAHGIRGEVSIESRTDSPDERFVPGAVLHSTGQSSIGGTDVPAQLTVRTVRDHNGTLLLTFEQIDDRSAAETLRNVLLEADVPEHTDEDDAWYDHELVGLVAISPAGETLGKVAAVQHGGAQDLLTIERPDGQRRLVPFVTAIVPTVDLAAGHVVLDAPAGLLEDIED